MKFLITLITIAQLASCCFAAGVQLARRGILPSALDERTADVQFNPGANGGGPQLRCNNITYSGGVPVNTIWGVDCDALLNQTANLHGIYNFQNWKFDGKYSMLWEYGTCNLGVYRTDGKNTYTQVGDSDLRTILTYCNKYLRNGYEMVKTSQGSMACAGLQGEGQAGMGWMLRSAP